MKVDVLTLQGQKLKETTLPKIFETEVDSGLIKRAVLAAQSARIQPKGPDPRAGRDNTAEYEGSRKKPQRNRTINIGHARLPRLKNRRVLISGRVAKVPQAVGGISVHRLKKETEVTEKINKKERKKAIASAIAATTNIELVKNRGHKFDKTLKLPLIVEDKLENIEKTQDVKKTLESLKIWSDIERAKKGRKARAGKGKKRGRPYKRIKSLLIVVENANKIYKAARNLEGVEIIRVKDLNAEALAPGAVPGRLTLWSDKAVSTL